MKGVSQIVGAVLLIAITVIAAVALYFMINNQQVKTNVNMEKIDEINVCMCTIQTNSRQFIHCGSLRKTMGDDLTRV